MVRTLEQQRHQLSHRADFYKKPSSAKNSRLLTKFPDFSQLLVTLHRVCSLFNDILPLFSNGMCNEWELLLRSSVLLNEFWISEEWLQGYHSYLFWLNHIQKNTLPMKSSVQAIWISKVFLLIHLKTWSTAREVWLIHFKFVDTSISTPIESTKLRQLEANFSDPWSKKFRYDSSLRSHTKICFLSVKHTAGCSRQKHIHVNSSEIKINHVNSLKLSYLHFSLSVKGPRQAADIPHAISLKSIWLSRFSSKAANMPGHTDKGTGGLINGRRVVRSRRPLLDLALKFQYLFSNSMISLSSTASWKKRV